MRRAIFPSSILIIGLFPEPRLQFFPGNILDGSQKGHGNLPYNFRYGLALETQHFPDSPNQPDFPSALLKKGKSTPRLQYLNSKPSKQLKNK
jgi:galactose mutarotase-like enzyme